MAAAADCGKTDGAGKMLIFTEEKLVLLAVPKTGTTAWEAVLGARADIVLRAPPRMKHMTLARFQAVLLPQLERAGCHGLETAAVLRAPEDWLGSWYRYRQRPALDGTPASTQGIPFEAFVQAYLSDDRPAYADLGHQARFVRPKPGHPAVDHLFRYEDQAGLAAFLASRLGPVAAPPRRNASQDQILSLSETTRDQLRRDRAADFALYEGISPS